MEIPFFSKKNRSSYYIALDIGTEFVKTIIFSDEHDNVNVKGVGKVRQPLSAVKAGRITNIKSVVNTSSMAIDQAIHNLNSFIPKEVVIGIAGELVKGIPITTNYTRDDPESKVSSDEIYEVFKEVCQAGTEQAKKIFADITGDDNLQIKLISGSIIDCIIDDNVVISPIGFAGNAMKITFYITYAPLMYVGALKEVANDLKLKPMLITAEPFAVAKSMSAGSSVSAIVIDIGGGTTDIAIISAGNLIDTHMLAFGGRVFTKRISHDLRIDYENAEKMKISYCMNTLEKAQANIVRNTIKKDIYLWVKGVELCLRECRDLKVFPSNILLCGGGSLLPDIKDILTQYSWIENLPFDTNPKVTFLAKDDIDSIYDPLEMVKGIEMITPLALARQSLDLKNGTEFSLI